MNCIPVSLSMSNLEILLKACAALDNGKASIIDLPINADFVKSSSLGICPKKLTGMDK
jgi:hypothetical protein